MSSQIQLSPVHLLPPPLKHLFTSHKSLLVSSPEPLACSQSRADDLCGEEAGTAATYSTHWLDYIKSGWWITKCQQAAFSSREASANRGARGVMVGGHGVLQVGLKQSGNRLQVCMLLCKTGWLSSKRLNYLYVKQMDGFPLFGTRQQVLRRLLSPVQILIPPLFSDLVKRIRCLICKCKKCDFSLLTNLVVFFFSSVLPWLVKTSPSAQISLSLISQSWMSVT